MNSAFYVACNLDNSIVYVTGRYSNSIAAINIADPSTPSRVGGIIDGTNLDAPIGIVYEASGDLLFVACWDGDALTVLSVADDAASPVVLGSVLSTSYMDGARNVASFPAAGLVFVTGVNSDSVCVVDVSDPSTPTVVDGLLHSTYIDAPFCVAWDPAAKLLFVAGRDSDSLAVVEVSDPSSPTLLGIVSSSAALALVIIVVVRSRHYRLLDFSFFLRASSPFLLHS